MLPNNLLILLLRRIQNLPIPFSQLRLFDHKPIFHQKRILILNRRRAESPSPLIAKRTPDRPPSLHPKHLAQITFPLLLRHYIDPETVLVNSNPTEFAEYYFVIFLVVSTVADRAIGLVVLPSFFFGRTERHHFAFLGVSMELLLLHLEVLDFFLEGVDEFVPWRRDLVNSESELFSHFALKIFDVWWKVWFLIWILIFKALDNPVQLASLLICRFHLRWASIHESPAVIW